jgi:2-dehydro-3-deoxygalactonokinase
LTLRYERALRARGIEPIVHSDALSAHGLHHLARQHPLID